MWKAETWAERGSGSFTWTGISENWVPLGAFMPSFLGSTY